MNCNTRIVQIANFFSPSYNKNDSNLGGAFIIYVMTRRFILKNFLKYEMRRPQNCSLKLRHHDTTILFQVKLEKVKNIGVPII